MIVPSNDTILWHSGNEVLVIFSPFALEAVGAVGDGFDVKTPETG